MDGLVTTEGAVPKLPKPPKFQEFYIFLPLTGIFVGFLLITHVYAGFPLTTRKYKVEICGFPTNNSQMGQKRKFSRCFQAISGVGFFCKVVS